MDHPSDNLRQTWARTAAYLRDARSNISQSAEGTCGNEIQGFEEHLQANELELALDMLEQTCDKSGMESW